MKAYNVFAVVLVDLVNGGVDEGFALPSLDYEFLLAGLQRRDGQQDVFDETEDAVFLDNLGCCDCLFDLITMC